MSSWYIDPMTRDYKMENGSPVQDETLLTPAYIRSMAHRGKWMYAPDDKWGSDFHLMHVRVKEYSSLIEAEQRALQPLIDEQRASDITVDVNQSARGAAGLSVKIVDNIGKPEVLNFTPVGGS